MANKKRQSNEAQKQPRDSNLNPFPGITGEGAEPNVARPAGGTTGGLYSDAGDGTIGNVGERYLERGADEPTHETLPDHAMTDGTSISPNSAQNAEASSYGTHRDTAGQLPHGQSGSTGAAGVGGMGSGSGRGRGGDTPGGVAGGDSSGSGGIGGGLVSDSTAQGVPRRSDVAGTSGGVAVSGGRGSDIGSVGGGMSPDLSPETSGGMSGGTFGGSRESDLGGGLSGGMRSGTGTDVSGGVGDSDDETIQGDQQRSPKRRSGRR